MYSQAKIDRLVEEVKQKMELEKVEAASKIAPGFITLGKTFGMSEQSAKTYAVQEMKK